MKPTPVCRRLVSMGLVASSVLSLLSLQAIAQNLTQDPALIVDSLAVPHGNQNLPPEVSLELIPIGATLSTGSTLTLSANATDTDGSIERVEFLANGAVVATAIAPPYQTRVTIKTSGAYRFAARATDDQDSKTTSTELTATASAAGTPPNLTVRDNLQLWLAADLGVNRNELGGVTSWFDGSGKSNDAFQIESGFAPTLVPSGIGELPAVRFDGIDDHLDVSDSESLSVAGDITSLFVIRMDDFSTFRSVWAKTQGSQPAPNDFYILPDSGIPRLRRGNGQGSLGFVDGGTPLTAGALQIVGFSSTAGTVVHLLNGNITSTGVIAATPADRDTRLKIGTRDDFVTILQGDLAELLIYNTGLTPANLEKVQLYLGEKYKIGLIEPTNSAPVVSITAPAPDTTLASPATVEVRATATDPDGSIVRIEFRLNDALAASDTDAPYTATLTFPTSDESVLTAVAFDNLGRQTVSAPVPIRVTSTTPVVLPLAHRLKLWLKADTGVASAEDGVSAWEDQSGNLNHAAQSETARRPQLVPNALNNRPALRFDGDNDALAIEHSLSLAMVGDLTSFFVVKVDDFATSRGVWAKTEGSQPRATDFYVVTNTGVPRALRGGSESGSVDGTSPLVAGEYAIVGFDMNGNTLRHSLNGAPNGEGLIAGTFSDTGRPLRIGTRDDGITRLRGDLAELIIYNASLGAEDQAAVISYLGGKYGISVVGGPPQISIARGADGTELTLSWPAAAADYALQSTDRLAGGTWQPVAGVTGTSATVPIGASNTYFRLAKP